MNRQEIIASLFDTMDIAKRSMHGHMQLVMSGSTISRTQLELLLTIRHLQPVTSKDLAKKLQLTPGAISQLADGLDKQFLIEREIDPTDRRRQTLRISKKGTALLKEVEKKRRNIMEHVMDGLSDKELSTWLHIQQKMINEFQQLHKEHTERKSA